MTDLHSSGSRREVFAGLERWALWVSVFLCAVTQATFSTAAAGVELGLLPEWVWMGCGAALLLLSGVMGSAVRQYEAPRRWRAVWLPLLALVVNTIAAAGWLWLSVPRAQP